MAIDWLGFGYAGAIIMGGLIGYKRKGSVMSLIAGLLFGCISAYGAYRVSNEPREVAVSLFASGSLALVMGIRFKKSGKLMPAGFMAGMSLLMVLRLLLMTLG
ncbi:transmembrane protein 14A [Clupea harengus]|uniref:Transmembrane protein 14A n=1 Tax=Clupea harengus TaxID=7950 RepID=A0A6P3WDI3_CLUHA|nr:transmembrane protein 14A [Clupea harengus]